MKMLTVVLHDIAAGVALAALVWAVWDHNLTATLILIPVTWLALAAWFSLIDNLEDESWR